MRNEIFNEYIKLAIKKELISKESIKRMASDSKENIENLYNHKSKDYENNIAELAHPKPVFLAPAYDKINGLVENVNERHNIMVNIMKKTPNGQYILPKYAAKHELLMSLVRVANKLDSENNEQLRKLADKCIEQTSNIKLGEAGAIPAALLGIALAPEVLTVISGLIYFTGWFSIPIIAGAIGAAYLFSHMDSFAAEPIKRIDKLIGELEDFKGSYLHNYIFQFQFRINKIISVFKNLQKYIGDMVSEFSNQSLSINGIEETSNDTSETKNKIKILSDKKNKINEAKQKFSKYYIYIDKLITLLSNPSYINKVRGKTENRTFIENTFDYISNHVLRGNHIIKTEFEDVISELKALQESMEKFISDIESVDVVENQSKDAIDENLNDNPASSPSVPTSTNPSPKSTTSPTASTSTNLSSTPTTSPPTAPTSIKP